MFHIWQFNLVGTTNDVFKRFAIDPYKAKHQFLINKLKNTGLKHFNDCKAFIEHSNDIDDIFQKIEEYNPNKKRKILTSFYDTIADMLSNKKLNLVVTELFIKGRKLNISLAFITQSYFAMPKNIWQINISTNINKLHLIARQILIY